jgi:drug/metabolite transporter (DMT)-like permease
MNLTASRQGKVPVFLIPAPFPGIMPVNHRPKMASVLVACCAVPVFGCLYPLVKQVIEPAGVLDAATFLFLRAVLTALALAPVLAASNGFGSAGRALVKNPLGTITGTGLLRLLYPLLVFYALSGMQAIHLILLSEITIAFEPFSTRLWTAHGKGRATIGAAMLVVAGTVLLLWPSGTAADPAPWAAILVITAAFVSSIIVPAVRSRLPPQVALEPVGSFFISNALAAGFLVPFVLASGSIRAIGSMDGTGILFTVIAGAGMAMMALVTNAVNRSDPNFPHYKYRIFSAFIPTTAILVTVFIFGEWLPWLGWIGALAILAAPVLAAIGESRVAATKDRFSGEIHWPG